MKKIYINENILLSESIENSLLRIRNAFIENDALYRDLAYSFSDLYESFLEEKGIEHDHHLEYLEMVENLSEKKLLEFGKFVYDKWKEDYYDMADMYYDQIPLFAASSLEGVVRNNWIVHFTNKLSSIEREGFKDGIIDINGLAYTGRVHQYMRSEDSYGYFYGFTPKDAIRYRGWTKYGKEAVLLFGSGVKIYHYGDEENQVIFNGAMVKYFVPINNNEGIWYVANKKTGEPIQEYDELDDMINWVIKNYDQYRKVISF